MTAIGGGAIELGYSKISPVLLMQPLWAIDDPRLNSTGIGWLSVVARYLDVG